MKNIQFNDIDYAQHVLMDGCPYCTASSSWHCSWHDLECYYRVAWIAYTGIYPKEGEEWDSE